jgi:hypothetical protein
LYSVRRKDFLDIEARQAQCPISQVFIPRTIISTAVNGELTEQCGVAWPLVRGRAFVGSRRLLKKKALGVWQGIPVWGFFSPVFLARHKRVAEENSSFRSSLSVNKKGAAISSMSVSTRKLRIAHRGAANNSAKIGPATSVCIPGDFRSQVTPHGNFQPRAVATISYYE